MNARHTLTGSRIALAFLLVSLAAGCATHRANNLHADCPAEQAQIERRLDEVLRAAEAKDWTRLDSYHLYGPKFTKFFGGSDARLDADAACRGEHEGLGAINGLKARPEDLKIDVFGDVGVATFILAYSFDSGGATVHRKERTTLVFVRDRGEWKIVHEHLSRITP